jgi:hypothetical protein
MTLWVNRVTSVRSRRLRNVRYASNTDRIDASQQNVVLADIAGQLALHPNPSYARVVRTSENIMEGVYATDREPKI